MQSLNINILFGKYFYVVLVVLLLFTCKESKQIALNIPFSSEEIKVDGVIEENEWKHGVLVDYLISPWVDNISDKTRFYTFVSHDYFNFCFSVVDSTLVTFPFETERTVIKEDRVELFFSKEASLEKYYCIEIDPFGNLLDYSAKFPREFNRSWDFSEINIKTKVNDFGYTVEGTILLKELKAIGISDQFYLGIFRADFKSHDLKDVCWISWINPNSSKPDFHIPSAFALTSFVREE